jgi:magnesium chelatase subunit I
MMRAGSYMGSVKEMIGLMGIIKTVTDSERPEEVAAAVEFIFEGLHLNRRLNKGKSDGKTVYRH